MTPIYVFRDERQLGPFEPTEAQRLLNSGELDRDDPAWIEGLETWEPLFLVLPKARGEALLTGPAIPARRRQEERPARRRAFLIDLPYSFIYPVSANGILLILAATAALVLAAVIGYVSQHRYSSGAALFIGGYTIGYACAFLVQVVRATASGCDELPSATDIASVHDEFTGPLLQIAGTTAGCLAPAALAWYWQRRGIIELDWLAPVLFGGGLLYLPMALLATVILGSVAAGLTPWVVLPAILRSLPRYLLVLLLIAGTLFGGAAIFAWLNEKLLWWAAAAAVLPVALYLLIVQARLLGLLFKASPNRLGWFG